MNVDDVELIWMVFITVIFGISGIWFLWEMGTAPGILLTGIAVLGFFGVLFVLCFFCFGSVVERYEKSLEAKA